MRKYPEMSNSKELLGLGFIYFNKRTILSRRSDKTKKKDFEYLGVANCQEAIIWGN